MVPPNAQRPCHCSQITAGLARSTDDDDDDPLALPTGADSPLAAISAGAVVARMRPSEKVASRPTWIGRRRAGPGAEVAAGTDSRREGGRRRPSDLPGGPAPPPTVLRLAVTGRSWSPHGHGWVGLTQRGAEDGAAGPAWEPDRAGSVLSDARSAASVTNEVPIVM